MIMSEISFLGLGLMGATLAGQVQQHGHAMTVWNRSPQKMQPFMDAGATGAKSLAEAIAASPVVVICIEDYAATRDMLEQGDATRSLADRTVVQLSTGTPLEAADSEAWFTSQGARYLDGAILGGPKNLHTDYAKIVFAGPEEAYQDAESVLKSLCRRIRYVGKNIRAASALDLGWLSRHYGLFLGMTHGVAVCEAEGVSLDLLAEVIPENEYAHAYVRQIYEARFGETAATLSTWATAFESFTRQAADTGINNEMPHLMNSWFERALDAGYGEEDVTALIKIFRE